MMANRLPAQDVLELDRLDEERRARAAAEYDRYRGARGNGSPGSGIASLGSSPSLYASVMGGSTT